MVRMKRLTTYLLLLILLFNNFALADTALITITSASGTCPPREIELIGTTPEQNFDRLERAIEVEGKPGDKVNYTGTFVAEVHDMLDLAKIVGGELTGNGPEASRLIFKAQHDRIGPLEAQIKPGGPAMMFPSDGEFRLASMYLENTPDNNHEDGALTGWAGSQNGTATVVCEDLVVKSHDWGFIYDWSLRVNRTVTLRRVKGVAARSFINLMHSASTYTLVMEDCDIGVDGNLSQSYGESSNGDPVTGGVMTPIIQRAGTGKVTNCTFWVRGMTPPAGFPAKWTPTRIATVATDQYFSKGSPATNLTFTNCQVASVDPGPAVSVIFDLDMRYGKATWNVEERTKPAEAKMLAAEAEVAAAEKLTSDAQAVLTVAAEELAKARGGTGPGGELRVWKAPE